MVKSVCWHQLIKVLTSLCFFLESPAYCNHLRSWCGQLCRFNLGFNPALTTSPVLQHAPIYLHTFPSPPRKLWREEFELYWGIKTTAEKRHVFLTRAADTGTQPTVRASLGGKYIWLYHVVNCKSMDQVVSCSSGYSNSCVPSPFLLLC